MTKAKAERVELWTPPGQFSFPYLVERDTGRQYSDNSFKTDLLISKVTFKEKGKEIQDKVLQVGKAKWGNNFKLKGGVYRIPFKDTDLDDKIEDDRQKGAILIRAKNKKRPPVVIGPRKDSSGKFPQLSKDEIANIKGGDWGSLLISVFTYDQQGGGVTFGLQAVQFWKEGEGFGQGKSKLLETAEELAAEVDSPDSGDVDTSDDDSDSIV